MQYSLCKFFGLQRSGNHAIINWLIGLDQDRTLFFNMVRPGESLLDKPSGVSLPEGTKAYATRVDGKIVIQPDYLDWFKCEGGRLLLSYENYPIGRFSQSFLDQPAINLFGNPYNNINFLVIRNPFHMLSSAERMIHPIMRNNGKDEKWLANVLETRLLLWKSYAFLHLHSSSITRGGFVSFVFDWWVKDKGYRDKMASKMGYDNKDKFIDFISDAGKGSSFSGSKLGERNDVLSRWGESSQLTHSVIARHPEVIDYTYIIFGEDEVPAEFKGLRI